MQRQLVAVVATAIVLVSCASNAAPPTASPAPSTPTPTATAKPPTPTPTPVPTNAPTLVPTSTPTSTDNAEIAFDRKDVENGTWDGFVLHVINADGSNDHVLLAGEHEVPRYSPDGSRVLFCTLGADGRVVPSIVNADGSGYHDLPVEVPLNLGVGVWSPDGTWIALEGWSDSDPTMAGIYIEHPDGTGVRQLVKMQGLHAIPGGFSPDGKQLVYSTEGDDTTPSQLRVVDLDTRLNRQIGDWQSGGYPGFMNDGRSLYVSLDGNLYIVDLNGKILRTLTVPTGHIAEPRLSPDGTRFVVLYDAYPASSTAIAWINADGTEFTPIVDADGVEENAPDWRPMPS